MFTEVNCWGLNFGSMKIEIYLLFDTFSDTFWKSERIGCMRLALKSVFFNNLCLIFGLKYKKTI